MNCWAVGPSLGKGCADPNPSGGKQQTWTADPEGSCKTFPPCQLTGGGKLSFWSTSFSAVDKLQRTRLTKNSYLGQNELARAHQTDI